jgi:hypothetical protein
VVVKDDDVLACSVSIDLPQVRGHVKSDHHCVVSECIDCGDGQTMRRERGAAALDSGAGEVGRRLRYWHVADP